MEAALALTILVVVIALYTTEWLRMDLVSLLALLAVALTGLVTVEEAFAGFGNPAVITVAAMFVISAAISNTGASGHVGERLLALAGKSEPRLIALIMLTVAASSAFVNNIGATAVLMPVVVNLAQRAHISPSKLLIPLAFGSLLGGVCTLIGTPPNILVNSLLYSYTGEEFAMFDFTLPGLAVLLVGVLYLSLAGRHLLPKRKSGTLTEAYQVKGYIVEVAIPEGSPLVGKTIAACGLERNFNLKVRALLRDRYKYPFPRRNRKIHEGDILFLEGEPEAIMKVRQLKGVEVVPERDNPPPETPGEQLVVVEASLKPNSELVGKTLRALRFRDEHKLTVLAIWRSGAPVVRKVEHVHLAFGDVLLIQGTERRIARLARTRDFLLLGGVDPVSYYPDKVPLAAAILAGVILLAATGVMPITLSATLGAALMVLTRCLSPREAYESIDWSVVVLIAGTLPLGLALEKSGAARLVADLLFGLVGPFGPWVSLGVIFLTTFLLTAVMSNAATVVLIAPIAFNMALDLGVDSKPFFLAVAIAASTCFMTPVSHQSNALVMGPGGYRFSDYLRVGTPLNLLVWLVATLLIPVVFPF